MGKRWLLVGLSVAAVAIAALVVVLVLIMRPDSRPPEAAPTSTARAAPSSTPTPTPPVPSDPPPPTYADPTCENIMAPHFTTDWVAVARPDREPAFADGIFCMWAADPTVGTDNVLIYAWAPHSREAWDALTTEMLDQESQDAWFLEDGDRGSYLTHKTDYWVQDDEGYGFTYLFTGDAIIAAATKAETDDVVGPPPA